MTKMTPLKYKQIEDKDVPQIQELYTAYPDFPAPQRIILPGDGTDGICILDDSDNIIGAGYAYYAANAPCAWIAWVVVKKDYTGNKTEVAKQIIERLCEMLHDAGYDFIISIASEYQHLIPIYKDAGFIDSGPAFKELIKTY